MGPGGPTLRSSPVRRFLLFSDSAEKSSLLSDLMPLKPSVSILPEFFQYLFRTAVGSKAGMTCFKLLDSACEAPIWSEISMVKAEFRICNEWKN